MNFERNYGSILARLQEEDDAKQQIELFSTVTWVYDCYAELLQGVECTLYANPLTTVEFPAVCMDNYNSNQNPNPKQEQVR